MRRIFWAAMLVVSCLAPTMASGAVKTEKVEYEYAGTKLQGLLAYDDAAKDKRPGVLVVHEFFGLDDYAKHRAEQLAELGYVAFAADMYGSGKVAKHPEEASAMMAEVRKNVKVWQGRAAAGLKALAANPHVDTTKLAAIGYCFGGATALELAYSGADIKAAVTFHGALPAPTADEAKAVKAKILICHGALDTFISDEAIKNLREGLDKANVDYAMIYFAGAVHSFTVPDADQRKMKGVAYNAAADKRSWHAMKDWLAAAFDEAEHK